MTYLHKQIYTFGMEIYVLSERAGAFVLVSKVGPFPMVMTERTYNPFHKRWGIVSGVLGA